jgi:hypothetical protein
LAFEVSAVRLEATVVGGSVAPEATAVRGTVAPEATVVEGTVALEVAADWMTLRKLPGTFSKRL